jgi:hypothetical protein
MKFSDWKLLKEYLSPDYLSKEAEKVKNAVSKEFKSLYSIPDFETFKRPNEPDQHSNLFTDEDLHTFAMNYTVKGDLYSVDVWKAEDVRPFVTYYIEDGSTDNLIKYLPSMVKQPSKTRVAEPKMKAVTENENVKITPQNPKVETPLGKEGNFTEEEPVSLQAKKVDDDYDYSDPDTVFEDLATYIDMVIKGTQPSLLITGSPGVGKTYTVLKQLKDAGLKKGVDFIHVKGRSTAAGMYITLYEENGKLIVFDDCDSVFGNADGVNVLKGALDSYGERDISWLVGRPLKDSSGKTVPKHFTFTGRVIFISNLPQRKIDDAIKSRSFVLEVALTPEDMLKKMRKDLPNVHPEIPLPIREDALEFIESVSKKSKNLELNMRTLVKAIKILRNVSDLKVAERLIMQQCSYK